MRRLRVACVRSMLCRPTPAISGRAKRRPNCESNLGDGLDGPLHRHCWTAPRLNHHVRSRPLAAGLFDRDRHPPYGGGIIGKLIHDDLVKDEPKHEAISLQRHFEHIVAKAVRPLSGVLALRRRFETRVGSSPVRAPDVAVRLAWSLPILIAREFLAPTLVSDPTVAQSVHLQQLSLVSIRKETVPTRLAGLTTSCLTWH